MDNATKLVEIAKRLYTRNMNAALGGNVSFRRGDEITITEAGINKGLMTEREVVVMDLGGNKLVGNGEPSSEGKMHYEIYKLRSDVHAIIHAHPPVCRRFRAGARGHSRRHPAGVQHASGARSLPSLRDAFNH